MSAITLKAQIVDGFVLVDRSDVPSAEALRDQERKETINNIAQTTLSVAAVSVFCALNPPVSSIAIGRLIGAGVITGVAGEQIRRTIVGT